MLELDLVTVLWQAVNFLILMVVLNRLLFKPVMQQIREQAEERQSQVRRLEEDRNRAAELRTELEARLSSADEEAEAVVARAEDQAAEEHAALIREAQSEVERIVTEAQMDAYRLKRQAIQEFHGELLDAVLDVTSLVIGRVAPEELHASMVQQLCDSVWELGQSDMHRVEVLRRSLGERTPTVVARTAQTLDPAQQGLVVRTFSALADRNVNIDLKVEPALGLGLQVRLGDLVMDNSIAGRLGELRESVVEALEERISHE